MADTDSIAGSGSKLEFWCDIGMVVVKLFALVFMLISRYQHLWYQTVILNDRNYVSRDLFGYDCLHEVAGTGAPICITPEDRNKLELWTDYQTTYIPRSEFNAKYVFYISLILLIIDFIAHVSSCFYFPRTAPVRYISPRRKWLNTAAKFWFFIIVVDILFLLSFVVTLFLAIELSISDSIILNQPNKLGFSFAFYAIAGSLFAGTVVMTVCTLFTKIRDNGGLNQNYHSELDARRPLNNATTSL